MNKDKKVDLTTVNNGVNIAVGALTLFTLVPGVITTIKWIKDERAAKKANRLNAKPDNVVITEDDKKA